MFPFRSHRSIGPSVACVRSTPRFTRRLLQRCYLTLMATILLMGPISFVEAAPKRSQAKIQTKAKKQTKGKKKAKPNVRALAKARAEEKAREKARIEASAIAAAKAAVFLFEGDETEPLRMQVVRLLNSNGMSVDTTLRSPDTAEQFRDMGAALNLAVYVHGRVRDSANGRAVATIVFRSGVTGRQIATARFEGERRRLVPDVEEGLWNRVKGPLTRACVDATKPNRRRHNAPMRIEAGTPIEDSPRRMQDGS
jgi:hypothetical protein